MDVEKNKYETPVKQAAGEPGSTSAAAQITLERGSGVYGQTEQVVSDVCDNTDQAVRKTCEMAKSYCSKNPGKIILISVISIGIGVGLLFLLVASSRHSITGRFAQSVVKPLSDIAQEIFGKSVLLAERVMQKIR